METVKHISVLLKSATRNVKLISRKGLKQMGKVWFDAKTKEYKHENGRSIPASDVRTLPHHRREVLRMAGVDSKDITVPVPNETQAEIKYVETILGDG